jgi:hypothetical protein
VFLGGPSQGLSPVACFPGAGVVPREFSRNFSHRRGVECRIIVPGDDLIALKGHLSAANEIWSERGKT